MAQSQQLLCKECGDACAVLLLNMDHPEPHQQEPGTHIVYVLGILKVTHPLDEMKFGAPTDLQVYVYTEKDGPCRCDGCGTDIRQGEVAVAETTWFTKPTMLAGSTSYEPWENAYLDETRRRQFDW